MNGSHTSPRNPSLPRGMRPRPTSPPSRPCKGTLGRPADGKKSRHGPAITADPQRFDFRTDDRGLVLVYLNDTLQGRAVDERAVTTALARSAPAAASEGPALSLGVFAAVAPSLKPATTLFQLALDKNGLVTGVSVDLTSGEATPLRGAVDPSTQRAAWQIGDDVIGAGLANLTEDVARALVFRADGWTQPWILMRIQEDQLTSSPATK